MDRADVTLQDTPALEALSRRRETLGDIDPAALAAGQDLLRVAKRMLTAFADTFSDFGLSPGRYAVLMALDVRRPSLTPSEIAGHLGVTRATMTGLIDGLVRDGLVERAAEGSDRRTRSISLTRQGDALIESVVPAIFRSMVALTAPLSPDERQMAVRLLTKVESGLVPATAAGPREDIRA